tara:strand:+ start:348 stop:566 length:219 start_codon:yes stop_codon:yes gene_type:complete
MTEKNDKIKSISIQKSSTSKTASDKKIEKGGPKGPEPTRYGDWEKGGKCVDFYTANFSCFSKTNYGSIKYGY